ncbi:MAG: toprim domain-containing protein [Bacteroidaceae bacterium]
MTWCNEQCFQNDEIVVAVEGQFDMINSNRVYPNTIANLTARISERKLSKLLDCQGVVFMLDNDEAGLGARETAMEYLAKHGQRVGYATYAGHDPDMLTSEAIHNALKPFIHPSKFLKYL